MPQYTLIGTPFSTYTRSIALGMTYKGIPFDQVNVVPHSDVACAHHPFGFLPTLLIRGIEVGGEKVDVNLRESQAIVRYVDRIRPEPTLQITDGTGHAVLAEQMWEFVSFAGSHGARRRLLPYNPPTHSRTDRQAFQRWKRASSNPASQQPMRTR